MLLTKEHLKSVIQIQVDIMYEILINEQQTEIQPVDAFGMTLKIYLAKRK